MSIKVLSIFLFGICWTWTGVRSNPGRPEISDSHNASRIFQIAEANRNTTEDGYLSLEDFTDIFHNFDMDGNQCIDKAEFETHWNDLNLGDNAAADRLFTHADTDRDGCIQRDPDYSRLFYYFDRDGDGKISEDEFKRVWFAMSA